MYFFVKKIMSYNYSFKNTLLILIFLLTNSLFAQSDSINQVKAQPPSETIEYVNQVISNLNLPEDKVASLPNENIKFNLSFIVSKEGKVNNVRIKNDIYEMSSYFENGMKNLPNWTPAKINGEDKSSREQLAIQLNLKVNENNITTNPEDSKIKFYGYFLEKFKINSKNKRELIKLGYQKDGVISVKFNVAFVLNTEGAIENLILKESNLNFLEEQIFEIVREYPWEVQKTNGELISKPFTLIMTLKIS